MVVHKVGILLTDNLKVSDFTLSIESTWIEYGQTGADRVVVLSMSHAIKRYIQYNDTSISWKEVCNSIEKKLFDDINFIIDEDYVFDTFEDMISHNYERHYKSSENTLIPIRIKSNDKFILLKMYYES